MIDDETCNNVLHTATRVIAHTFYGERGLWAYDEFERLNTRYFFGALPWPLITWALTAHGRCLGFTRSSREHPPVITLHPSLLGGTEKRNPWHVDPAWLGWRYALDTLLHECMHVSVNYRLGGATGPTSHNNPQWIAEVNRLAPLLELPITAAMSRTKRVKDTDARSRVIRVSDSSVSFEAISRFPYGVRVELGRAAGYYTECDTQLDVTARRWA
jgi:hypothetical protein